MYLLRDGIAVYARDFPPSDFSLKIVAQERFGANLVTVFRQGALQISLETPAGFSVSELPEAFGKCSLRYESGLFFLEGEGMLAAFSADGKCVFSERVSAYKIENGTLTATLPLVGQPRTVCRMQLGTHGGGVLSNRLPHPPGRRSGKGAKRASALRLL